MTRTSIRNGSLIYTKGDFKTAGIYPAVPVTGTWYSTNLTNIELLWVWVEQTNTETDAKNIDVEILQPDGSYMAVSGDIDNATKKYHRPRPSGGMERTGNSCAFGLVSEDGLGNPLSIGTSLRYDAVSIRVKLDSVAGTAQTLESSIGYIQH